jgi:hypothetical protein
MKRDWSRLPEFAARRRAVGHGYCRRVLTDRSVQDLSLALSAAVFASAAAAQTPLGPTIGGRHLQPTEQQVESRENGGAREWNSHTQSEIDPLYCEIMGAATRVQH